MDQTLCRQIDTALWRSRTQLAGGDRFLSPTCIGNGGSSGIDLSIEILDTARSKSVQLPNVRWMQAYMRSFDLGEHFRLAIVPAYSLQLLPAESDQAPVSDRSRGI